MIKSFRHKGLKELFTTGKSAKINPPLRQRCSDVLEVLDATEVLSDINLPGYNFHPLKTKPVRYSIHVNGPWCITFEFEAPDAWRGDLEQYH